MKHRKIQNMTEDELWKLKQKLWKQQERLQQKLALIDAREYHLRQPDL